MFRAFVFIFLCVKAVSCEQFPDQIAEESENDGIRIAQPSTHGTRLQQEIQRLQTLSNDVFPPSNLSYLTPYGDQTVLALQFPEISDEDLDPFGSFALPAKSPFYSSQPKKALKRPQDFGVILSQNYVYRENVRDYTGFSQPFRAGRPSQDLLSEVARVLAHAQQSKEKKDVKKSLINQLSKELLARLKQKQESFGWGWPEPEKSPSFLLVAVESRAKLSRAMLLGEGSTLTNGSVYFPSPSNPEVVTHIPFVGSLSKDIFKGYEDDMKGLVPRERSRITSSLKLIEGIHEDSYQDGRERIQRVRRLSSGLSRPRLPKTDLLRDDPLEQAEDAARENLWLYTSTVALRTLKPKRVEPPKITVELEKPKYGSVGPHPPLVELVEDYGPPPGPSGHSHSQSYFYRTLPKFFHK